MQFKFSHDEIKCVAYGCLQSALGANFKCLWITFSIKGILSVHKVQSLAM